MANEPLPTKLRKLANKLDKIDQEQSPRKKKALALEALDSAEEAVDKLKEIAGE